MRKTGAGYFIAAVVLMLLGVFVILPSGAGPSALDREKAFIGGLHNSLYHLDLAKQNSHKLFYLTQKAKVVLGQTVSIVRFFA